MDPLTRLTHLLLFHLARDLDTKLASLVCRLASYADGVFVLLGGTMSDAFYDSLTLPTPSDPTLSVPAQIHGFTQGAVASHWAIISEIEGILASLREEDFRDQTPNLEALIEEDQRVSEELRGEIARSRELRERLERGRVDLLAHFCGNAGPP